MSGGFACLCRIRRLLASALLGFGTGDVAHAAKGLFQNFLVQLAHPVAKGGRHKQLTAVLGILQPVSYTHLDVDKRQGYSRDVMDIMTRLRKEWGMKYPGEEWD